MNIIFNKIQSMSHFKNFYYLFFNKNKLLNAETVLKIINKYLFNIDLYIFTLKLNASINTILFC